MQPVENYPLRGGGPFRTVIVGGDEHQGGQDAIAEPHAAYGMAGEELAMYNASLDLLVVGSRGYGPLGRLAHGSTSRQLARAARCPLLVLTRNACARLRTDHDHAPEATAMVS